jgi:hypothetical protein
LSWEITAAQPVVELRVAPIGQRWPKGRPAETNALKRGAALIIPNIFRTCLEKRAATLALRTSDASLNVSTLSIVEEVETALSSSSNINALETLAWVADLYLSSSGQYAADQVEVLDKVFEHLSASSRQLRFAQLQKQCPNCSCRTQRPACECFAGTAIGGSPARSKRRNQRR